jgi:hypothetical protein
VRKTNHTQQQQWSRPMPCPLLWHWRCDLIREIGSSSGSKSEGSKGADGVAREASITAQKVQKVGMTEVSGIAKTDGS